jgi:hypothetical protein
VEPPDATALLVPTAGVGEEPEPEPTDSTVALTPAAPWSAIFIAASPAAVFAAASSTAIIVVASSTGFAVAASSVTAIDVSYVAPLAHGIVNVALHREYSPGIVFIFSQRRNDLYHV